MRTDGLDEQARGARARRVLWAYPIVLVALVASVLAAAGGREPQAALPLVPAQQADAFVDSIGVNTHMYYLDTPYGGWDNLVTPALRDLGVRHIRDMGVVLWDNSYLDYLKRLHSQLGIKTLLMMDPRWVTTTQAQQIAEYVGPALWGVEGPNEWDLYSPNWATTIVDYTRQLDTTLAADPDTANLPLVAPTLIHWDTPAQIAGQLTSSVEYGNFHPYPYPNRPSSTIDGEIGRRTPPTGTRPLIATESGYQTANAPRTVSEAQQAKYLPRLFLEYFRRGIVRTYSYELLDEFADATNPEARFGMIRYDGTRKPAFDALRNLITLLSDPGPAFTPSGLAYQLTSNGTVSQLLLQRRDGSYQLVLWNEVESAVSGADTNTSATLTLERGSDVRAFRPNGGLAPVQSWTGATTISLTVPDQPLVLEIRPAAGAPTTTTPTTATPTTATPTTATPTTATPTTAAAPSTTATTRPTTTTAPPATTSTTRPTTTTAPPTTAPPATTSTTTPSPWVASGAAVASGDGFDLVRRTGGSTGVVQGRGTTSTNDLRINFRLTMEGGAGPSGVVVSLLDPASTGSVPNASDASVHVAFSADGRSTLMAVVTSPNGDSATTTTDDLPRAWTTNDLQIRFRQGWMTVWIDGRQVLSTQVTVLPTARIAFHSTSGGAVDRQRISAILVTAS